MKPTLNETIETPANVNECERERVRESQMQNGFSYELLNEWQAKTMAYANVTKHEMSMVTWLTSAFVRFCNTGIVYFVIVVVTATNAATTVYLFSCIAILFTAFQFRICIVFSNLNWQFTLKRLLTYFTAGICLNACGDAWYRYNECVLRYWI